MTGSWASQAGVEGPGAEQCLNCRRIAEPFFQTVTVPSIGLQVKNSYLLYRLETMLWFPFPAPSLRLRLIVSMGWVGLHRRGGATENSQKRYEILIAGLRLRRAIPLNSTGTRKTGAGGGRQRTSGVERDGGLETLVQCWSLARLHTRGRLIADRWNKGLLRFTLYPHSKVARRSSARLTPS